VEARSKSWVCGRSLARIVGSNPTGIMYVLLSFVSVAYCEVELLAECDCGASIVRGP
jgi:hypothetical protein